MSSAMLPALAGTRWFKVIGFGVETLSLEFVFRVVFSEVIVFRVVCRGDSIYGCFLKFNVGLSFKCN